MKSNKNTLVKMAVQASVDHPKLNGYGYRVGYDGKGRIPMGTGGIVYNFKIGDNCMEVVGDHIEPGVSLKNQNDKYNYAFNTYACIGNIAKVISGDAKGRYGYITGKHGGIDHVMAYFDEETLELMTSDDKVSVKAFGQGYRLDDFPNLHIMNIDPDLFEKMVRIEDNQVVVKVTHIIPACLMGSGLGVSTMMQGDYDIMTQDKQANEEYNLNSLRFGDIVAIEDHDNHYGPHYRKNALSIGVIVHSDSFTSGHGPGVCVIMSSKENEVKVELDANANLAKYLNI